MEINIVNDMLEALDKNRKMLSDLGEPIINCKNNDKKDDENDDKKDDENNDKKDDENDDKEDDENDDMTFDLDQPLNGEVGERPKTKQENVKKGKSASQ